MRWLDRREIETGRTPAGKGVSRPAIGSGKRSGSLAADECEDVAVHQIGVCGAHAVRQVLVDLERSVFQ